MYRRCVWGWLDFPFVAPLCNIPTRLVLLLYALKGKYILTEYWEALIVSWHFIKYSLTDEYF